MSSHPQNSIPESSRWRDLMSERELLSYDSGVISQESARVSRNNRLVPLNDKALAHIVNPTPEDHARANEYLRALEVVATIPSKCSLCKRPMPGEGESRVCILSYLRDAVVPQRAYLYCPGCFAALGLTLEGRDWFAELSPIDQKIWQLLTEGLTQAEVAARLTKGKQRVTQQQVSEAKQRVTKKIREWRQLLGRDKEVNRDTSTAKSESETVRALLVST